METTIPSASEAIGYAELLTNYPNLIVGMIVGLFAGIVITLAGQRLGWLPNGKAGELAQLRSEVEHLEEKLTELVDELKPWRRIQERLTEEFLLEMRSKE